MRQKENTADDSRTEQLKNEMAALEELREELEQAESIGDTRLSELFHEARTADTDIYSGATCILGLEDEAYPTDVIKTRPGEHLRDNPGFAAVSCPAKPFMTSERFVDIVDEQLWSIIDSKQNTLMTLQD
ncbi:hypothetical protein B4589_009755 [Halolamina sp. CBA1230]|uniref:hypothetical protein n=1 Tax=Halolamina sp. CBA1230 TaxID=1853690 RepID=UPI0009A20E97|nr:hypothetical protein [Halolamina sp. CBA1230]QKY20649.1 hypothetical protein B4589_009755 [Halolamina sp. CBA1230]